MSSPTSGFGAFRHSLLLRLDPGDIPDELEGIFGPLARELRKQSSRAHADLLLEYIQEDVATIHARVRETWHERVAGAIGDDIELKLRPGQLALEAYVWPPPHGSTAEINLSAGTVLALDDLTLFALTLKPVLMPDRAALDIGEVSEDFDPPAPLAVRGARLERPGRFFEYRDALAAGLNHALLTFAMPCAPWRLAQASLLSELALAWVLLHERAHWALGHLDLLADLGVSDLRLDEIPRGLELALGKHGQQRRMAKREQRDFAIRRVLEGEADTQAFLLLCDYAMRAGGAAERYEAIAGSFGVPDDPRALRKVSGAVCLRLCITAVSIACVLFHERRKDTSSQRPGSHPTPAARLLSMLVNCLIITPLCRQNEEGHWVIAAAERTDQAGEDTAAFRAITHEGMAMGLTDLMVIANEVGTDFGPIDFEDGSSKTWRVSDWLKDLMSFWVAEGTTQTPCITAAGKEIRHLRDLERELLPRLEALQERRFGRVMKLELGETWRQSF